jgi:hypothetical protein
MLGNRASLHVEVITLLQKICGKKISEEVMH